MRCRNCGQEIGEAAQCGYCGYAARDANVREMSQSEKYGYQGMTIDETGSAGEEEHETFYRSPGGGSRIFVRGIQLGHSGTWMEKLLQNYWLSRLAIGLVVAAIATFLFFVALPIMLTVAGVGIVVWLMLRFLHTGS